MLLLESFVRLGGQVEIEPAETTVVAADDKIVASRVNVDRADPANVRQQLLDQYLFDQVVDFYVSLRL